MNIRDLKPNMLKKLAAESDGAYEEWLRSTNGGVQFGTQKPLEPLEIFRWAFSKGASAVLRRVDELKENV